EDVLRRFRNRLQKRSGGRMEDRSQIADSSQALDRFDTRSRCHDVRRRIIQKRRNCTPGHPDIVLRYRVRLWQLPGFLSEQSCRELEAGSILHASAGSSLESPLPPGTALA